MYAFPRPLEYPEVSTISSFGIQQLTTRRSCPGLRERLPQVRALHRCPMCLTDADTVVHSPRAVTTGFVAPWRFPPPRRLPRHPHTSMGGLSRSLAYPDVGTILSFGVQRLTTRGSCPGSPSPCSDSGSVSLKYVRYTDTAYTSVMPVVPSTVYPRRHPPFSILAVLPPPPFFPAPFVPPRASQFHPLTDTKYQ